MASNINPADLERLKGFIEACKQNPQVIYVPQLSFFREYLESLGCTLPKEEKPMPSATEESKQPDPPKPSSEEQNSEEVPDEESQESEVELDTEGVLEPETIDPPELGDAAKVVSEDDEVAAGEKRSEAMMAFSEGEMDKAMDLYTEAIKLNPSSALLYAKRASILLKQKRVKAALRDCDEAIKLNPDSASAHKFRGRAHRLLGNWLEAARDLRLACKLDFDEQADEWLKEVLPNATKLEDHQRKYERKRQEKEINERREKIRKAQEEAKAQQSKKQSFSNDSEDSDFNGGLPPGFEQLFNDPELIAGMKDPEVAKALQDVISNPANFLKYQSNPKVANILNKFMQKFGGGMAGGMPGGMPGGFPGMFSPGGMSDMPSGFPGFGGSSGPSSTQNKDPSDDLD